MSSPAYQGNETDGYFQEVTCDFDDTSTLKNTLEQIIEGKVIIHCRMEEAIKDYKKIIPLLDSAFVPTVEALTLSTEKYKMREAISTLYPEICPKFIKLENFTEFSKEIISDFTYPVIVKPNGLHSSFFVTKCHDFEQLKSSLQSAFSGLDDVYAREYGTGMPSLLIEEFIVGEMYSIDAYVNAEGKCWYLPPVRVITAAEVGLDGYYSYRHILPSDLKTEDVAAANECSRKAIHALGLTSSTAHIELYKTLEGWKIIELGPRIGGYRQELYEEAFGIQHYLNDILIHFGAVPDTTAKCHRFAAGMNIYADTEGTITQIAGYAEAKSLESIVQLNLCTSVGNSAVFNSNGGKFLVDGILSNNNEQALERDVEKVRDLIKFTIS